MLPAWAVSCRYRAAGEEG